MKIILAIVIIVLVVSVILYIRFRPGTKQVPASQLSASANTLMIDPSKLLYSLATICDRLPPTTRSATKPSAHDLVMHEDDWRQIEFVSLENSTYINEELKKLKQFKEKNREGIGYRNIYVRKDHPHELNSLGLALDILWGVLPPEVIQGRLFLGSGENIAEVEGGFAIRLADGTALYGQTIQGIVTTLGLQPSWESSDSNATAKVIARIASVVEAKLIDWYWAQESDPKNVASVQVWLQAHADQAKRLAEEWAKKKQ